MPSDPSPVALVAEASVGHDECGHALQCRYLCPVCGDPFLEFVATAPPSSDVTIRDALRFHEDWQHPSERTELP